MELRRRLRPKLSRLGREVTNKMSRFVEENISNGLRFSSGGANDLKHAAAWGV